MGDGAYVLALLGRLRTYRGSEDAIELMDEAADALAAFQRSIVAHHDIANLSREAIAESLGGPCQICARAQKR